MRTSPSIEALTRRFSAHLQESVRSLRPDFLVPLETKGAVLLDLSMAAVAAGLPSIPRIIYPRAFDYLDSEELRRSRFLVVDDAVYSGTTLKAVRDRLCELGVPPGAIHLTALLDFVTGVPDVDFHTDIYNSVTFAPADAPITRDEALRLIHEELLSSRMPATYDHLLLEASHTSPEQFEELLHAGARRGRTLYYGPRGAFTTATVLLDDLLPDYHPWDLPPKLRLWYHPHRAVLRLAPVAAPWFGDISTRHIPSSLIHLFVSAARSPSPDALRTTATWDALVLSARIALLPYVSALLQEAAIRPVLSITHLSRYYPGFAQEVAALVDDALAKPSDLPTRAATTDDAPIPYLRTAKRLIATLRSAYEGQAAQGVRRKDFRPQGFTAAELAQQHDDLSPEELHSALDFCFDMNYVTAFPRTVPSIGRAIRTTESLDHYMAAEIYGAAVIFATPQPTPAWLLTKVFPVLLNSASARLDGIIVCRKGPFGDYSSVVLSESSPVYWRDVPTDLWTTSGGDEEKELTFRPAADKRDWFPVIARDARIASLRTPLEAVRFLLEQGGRNGAILLNIAGSGRGGLDYMAYNVEQILAQALGSRKDADKRRRQHSDGVREKLRLVRLHIASPRISALSRMANRCSRLQATPLTQAEARAIVNSAMFLPSLLLYDAMGELAEAVIEAAEAVRRGATLRALSQLLSLGLIPQNPATMGRSLLFHAARRIANWGAALGFTCLPDSHYKDYVASEELQGAYIMAYDLTSARNEVAARRSVGVDVINRQLNALAENWIIALGGQLSRSELNSGDLRYGFFDSLEDALQAATWLLRHASEVSHTHAYVPSRPYGVAVVHGSIATDSRGNHTGPALDAAGHALKGKLALKECLEDVAGRAGRVGRSLEQSPLQLLWDKGVDLPSVIPVMARHDGKRSDGVPVEVLAIDVDRYVEQQRTPWRHRARPTSPKNRTLKRPAARRS